MFASVITVMGVEPFVANWRELYPSTEPPRLTPQELLTALAQGEGITSNEGFVQRIQTDAQFKARADEMIAFAGSPRANESHASDEMSPDDPLSAALSVLFQADSDRALAEALAGHPILAEADALFALAGLINQALADQQNETVARLVFTLVVLTEQYNHAHAGQFDTEAHVAVIGLCEQVIPLAEQISADLAAALRQQAGWACNTLGNHYASDGENLDLEQAVAAYNRGVTFDPGNAMLLRNRAGAYLDQRDPASAQADIEAAAELEPDAPRLAELREQLAAISKTLGIPGVSPESGIE